MSIRTGFERVTLIAGACIGLAGCAVPMVDVGGFHVYKDYWDDSAKAARAQASFSTSCPADNVQVTLLAVDPSNDHMPATLGTTGCGNKLVYQRLPGGHVVLNSDNGHEPSK